MNGTPTLERLRLAGASCGAVFAVLAFIAYAINTGPSSGDGVTVVQYYSTHESATLGRPPSLDWRQSASSGSRRRSLQQCPWRPPASPARPAWSPSTSWPSAARRSSARSMAALTPSTSERGLQRRACAPRRRRRRRPHGELRGRGVCWRDRCRDPRLGWAMASAGLARHRSRRISRDQCAAQLTSTSHWSDTVAIAGFLAFLAWGFAASVMLVVALRRGTALVPEPVA